MIRSAPPFEYDSQVAARIGREQILAWAVDVASRFPLTHDDLIRIQHESEDRLDLARELVARFSPKWFLSWRDICRSTDERTLIAAILPRVAIGNSTQLVLRQNARQAELACLLANFCSLPCDYFVRQKMGGTHVNHQIIKQFPIFPPEYYRQRQPWQPIDEVFGDWVKARVLELTFTAQDLKTFAEDCNWYGPAFDWDESRRVRLRAELDAAYLHAYGLPREDAAYILSAANFPIVAAKSPHIFPLILSVYDAMSDASRMGVPFEGGLIPPPGKRGER